MPASVRPVHAAVYCPVVTFFTPEEDLDIPAFQKHVVWVAGSGMDIVIAGTNGEAAHLTHADRIALVKAAREALNEAGLTDVVIISGGSTSSTRETIQFCKEAGEAGADAAICLLSSPFAAVLKDNAACLKQHFTDVAKASPIPILIYNYPVAAAGIDISSDLILDLAKTCPNIVGAKLTCANMGKLARIASVTSSSSFIKSYPRSGHASTPFWIGSGYADFLFPSVLGRSTGCITGVGNVAPAAIAHLYKESVNAFQSGSLDAMKSTQELQDIVSAADGALSGAGIGGTKYVLSKIRGYGGVPRKPLPAMDVAKGPALMEALEPILSLERSLSKNSKFGGVNGVTNGVNGSA